MFLTTMQTTPESKFKKAVTETEATKRGYTHVTVTYRKCEFAMLDRAIADMKTEEYLLVITRRPPGLQIWRPKNKVALG